MQCGALPQLAVTHTAARVSHASQPEPSPTVTSIRPSDLPEVTVPARGSPSHAWARAAFLQHITSARATVIFQLTLSRPSPPVELLLVVLVVRLVLLLVRARPTRSHLVIVVTLAAEHPSLRPPTPLQCDGGSATRSLRRLEQSWRIYHALWLSPK
eukprot:3177351-Rhodomonas_salina.1